MPPRTRIRPVYHGADRSATHNIEYYSCCCDQIPSLKFCRTPDLHRATELSTQEEQGPGDLNFEDCDMGFHVMNDTDFPGCRARRSRISGTRLPGLLETWGRVPRRSARRRLDFTSRRPLQGCPPQGHCVASTFPTDEIAGVCMNLRGWMLPY